MVFVIQMKGVSVFRPNDSTHRQFGDALRLACQKGVNIIAVDCRVTPDTMEIDGRVEIDLDTKEE